MIVPMVPYCPRDVGGGTYLMHAYRECMDRLRDDDWACFMDHDTFLTRPDWYRTLEAAIADHPDAGFLTCVANDASSMQRVMDRVKRDDEARTDLDAMLAMGSRCHAEHGSEATDITETIHKKPVGLLSGLFMVIRKQAWIDAGLHEVSKERGEPDVLEYTDFFIIKALSQTRWRMYLLKGLFVYHYAWGKTVSHGFQSSQREMELAHTLDLPLRAPFDPKKIGTYVDPRGMPISAFIPV